MYRMDINTDEGIFTLHETELENITEESPLVSVVDVVGDLEAGNFFKGYPPLADKEGDPVMFRLGKDASIKSYVFYPYSPLPKVEDPEDVGPVEGEVVPFTMRTEYLGNKLTVTGVELYQEGVFHFLPIKVNGEPQNAYIKPGALSQLLMAWAETERGLPVTDYLVIVPEVGMDYVTSSEYLVDYVGQTNKERAGTNAKAWNGWRPGSDE